MNESPLIVFVCEHGAAKSIVAATYFNKLASEKGVDLRAVARGTNPDHELSPQAIKGLSGDGLRSLESAPQKITQLDIQSAERVITFCELPVEYRPRGTVERWEDVPPVSENYEKARDAIIEHINHLIRQIV